MPFSEVSGLLKKDQISLIAPSECGSDLFPHFTDEDAEVQSDKTVEVPVAIFGIYVHCTAQCLSEIPELA